MSADSGNGGYAVILGGLITGLNDIGGRMMINVGFSATEVGGTAALSGGLSRSKTLEAPL